MTPCMSNKDSAPEAGVVTIDRGVVSDTLHVK